MTKIGVVIGRFQAAYLTDAHRSILQRAALNEDLLVVLLGCSQAINTKRDPLDFLMRNQLIQSWAKTETTRPVLVYPIHDHPSDAEWVKSVDRLLFDTFLASGEVTLYGGHDSCLSTYNRNGGKYKTMEYPQLAGVHASEMRKRIKPEPTYDFRAGMIYAAESRFTSVFPVVDVLVRKPVDFGYDLLLGHKKTDPDDRYRLIGGFVDPKDPTLEYTVGREVKEETGCEIGQLRYAGSHKVPDYRYRGPEQVMSSVFVADYVFGNPKVGNPKAGDDLYYLRWFSVKEARRVIIEEHRPLLELALRLA